MAKQPSDRRAVLGARLRAAREMAGLSQGQVARMLKIHRPSVTESEAGRRGVSAEEIAQLAKIYDVSVAWLLGERGGILDAHDDRIQLAARELRKLNPKDLERLLYVLSSLRDDEERT